MARVTPGAISAPLDESNRRRARFSGWAMLTLIFIALAAISFFQWDARIVQSVHNAGLDKWAKKWVWVRKLRIIWPGHFFFTLLAAALVARFHRIGARGAWALIVAGIFSGANSIIKWAVGRPRPDSHSGTPGFTFTPFKNGITGLFSQENLAFPSGDVALAVSSAAMLTYFLRAGRRSGGLWPASLAFSESRRMLII